MITVERLTYTYPGGRRAIHDLSLVIPDGAFVLVTGESGSGKSTLLRALNGLVPQFYGGVYSGGVRVDDHPTLGTPTRTLAQAVGFVFQDPEAQFVVQTVEDELCFGMENLGLTPAEMRQRLDEITAMLGISHLLRRRVATLSGGEAQRVAIASALVLRPRHLILDEPTSQLDPLAAHTVLEALVKLNCAHRLTIILAEHRLERVIDSATHLLHLSQDGVRFGAVREVLLHTPLRPPIVSLALQMGWQPLPLTVAEARQFLSAMAIPPIDHAPTVPLATPEAISVRDLSAGYGARPVLDGFTWSVRTSEIVGLLGSNGSGKSTLLKSLVGLLKPKAGTIFVMGESIHGREVATLAQRIGYVPQNPNSVLFAETLGEEVAFTLRNHGQAGEVAAILARFGLAGMAERYPRDLSGGERQRAALAAMLATEPPIMLLDEPTRGLDYGQKERLAALIQGWGAQGKTVIIATHDVEWIAGVATRCTVLSGGRIIADGDPGAVLLTTPGFNTQLGELFADPRRMTWERR
jgi:energy-coupling factor transport system ATP-binding protein